MGIDREDITGLVLAGGRGSRMGGRDKGLQPFAGETLISRVVRRLAPQVGSLLINANRNRESYAAFGYPVIADRVDGYAGPLAGLHAGLCACATPFLVSAPCDSPFLPATLVARLATALGRSGACIAYARSGAQRHPAFLLCRRDALPELEQELVSGQRKIDTWCARLGAVEVDFADDRAFANINTLEELQRKLT